MEENNPQIPTNIKRMATKRKILFVVISILFVAISGIKTASAASLYFSPNSGSYAINGTISLNVYVSSADQAMNAASGVISFPQDKLQVVSLSKTGSIFSLWVSEPSFSNSDGTVNFEGITLNPGFTGSSGKIISVVFKVKSSGSASITFSSGSVLANDGKGTNILTKLDTAQFNLSGTAAPTVAPSAGNVPAAPQISSLTHPDPEKWYALSNAKFNWQLSSDITGVQFSFDQTASAIPTTTSAAVSEKEIGGVADGIWYFHLRLSNTFGWSKTSNFRFQIDTQPPASFSIEFPDGSQTDNPQPKILFGTADSLSGIDYYKIKIGDGEFLKIGASEVSRNAPYVMPLQTPGQKTILIQALDKAGNYTSSQAEITILSIAFPIFTSYPDKLQSGEILTAKGTALTNSKVVVYLQRENDQAKSSTIKSDENGNFVFTSDGGLSEGNYKMWAQTIDNRGAISNPSAGISIAVGQSIFFKIASLLISIFSLIIPLVALIVLLMFLILYGWYRFYLFSEKLRKEACEKEIRKENQSLYKVIDVLRKNIQEQINMLEEIKNKRTLTEEEEKIINHLKKNLDEVEESTGKEIEEIKEK